MSRLVHKIRILFRGINGLMESIGLQMDFYNDGVEEGELTTTVLVQ